MTEKELCWKCKEELMKLENTAPITTVFLEKVFHCHHSQKEKEKCVCGCQDYGRSNFPSSVRDIFKIICKKCGRDLS